MIHRPGVLITGTRAEVVAADFELRPVDFGNGSTGGVILNLLSGGFDGTFGKDFGTFGETGLADTGVPEPGTLSLVLLGGVALAAAARRGRRTSRLR